MYEKSLVVGVPKGEEGIMDARMLGAHIKAARNQTLMSAAELAQALEDLGCRTNLDRVQAMERGALMPRLTEFFAIFAVTAPPAGLKHFAPAWPKMWPMIERALDGQRSKKPIPRKKPSPRRKP